MLIAETISGYGAGDSFEVNLPNDFAYYERSWSLGNFVTGGCANPSATYRLDGALLAAHYGLNWQISDGSLTAAQLLPGIFHTINVNQACNGSIFGGLAITYRIP